MFFSSIYTHPQTAALSLCHFLPFFGISKNATKINQKNKRKHVLNWVYLSNNNSFEVYQKVSLEWMICSDKRTCLLLFFSDKFVYYEFL